MLPHKKNQLIVFFDFDNTVTQRDVLGAVIEEFSINRDWIHYENQWRTGKIGSAECMEAQLRQVRVSRPALTEFIRRIPIDPDFPVLLEWLRRKNIPAQILSDSFSALIQGVLEHHGIENIPVYANEIQFEGDRLLPVFPYRSPDCARCAHCKKRQLLAHRDKTRIYAGDGLSDICPAMEAEIVFAKGDLRDSMTGQGKAFTSFSGLGDILDFFKKRNLQTAQV